MSENWLRAVAALALSPMLAATPAGPALAQSAARGVDEARLADLPGFVDGVVAQQIATRQVAGAVVSVVYRGRVLFTRGYGFADIERGATVDPERTLFHPGSVSKLFTWVALMQQVEAGRVSLDADVDAYLDFRVPTLAGSGPIRVRDLLSHSPGMSDVGDLIGYDPAKTMPYQQWLKTHVPQRLWPAGTEIAYSNWGAALAGYIVERVSGEPYPDYVDRHIFQPLGMASSSFREPLPPALEPRLATGYRVVDGRLVAKPHELLRNVTPAGSLSATGPDMARFMLAMLGGGALGDARILKPASVRLLESDSFANAPGLPGMAHGFLVERESGPRLVGHAGNSVDFHSDLVLAPDERLGFFVSESGGPGSYPARTELRDALIGRLFPETPAPRFTGEATAPTLGHYRANRRDYSKPANPANDMVVSQPAPHRLTTTFEGVTVSWDQIGPTLYEQVTGARAGGPYDKLEFYGPATDRRLSLASQPYQTYHFVTAP